MNRTGVPIVFRQEGVPTETAGQFEEHEIARMVAPLLFSFADSDGSPTVVARVGAGVIPNGQPQVYFKSNTFSKLILKIPIRVVNTYVIYFLIVSGVPRLVWDPASWSAAWWWVILAAQASQSECCWLVSQFDQGVEDTAIPIYAPYRRASKYITTPRSIYSLRRSSMLPQW